MEGYVRGNARDSSLQLPVVAVKGFISQHTADYATILSLTDTLPAQFDNFSMDKYLNAVPGIQWQSREGGSTKISIRGSGLSSQFGVRDLKIYVDDIPITSPDGFTPIELIDPFLFKGIEIFKGPSATTSYGAENGGTLIFKHDTIFQPGLSASGGIATGQFGATRAESQVAYSGMNGFVSFNAVSQNTNGYRQLEYVHRDLLDLFGQFNKRRNHLTFWAAYNYGNWGLPGSVTLQNAVANPTLALPYSVYANAHLKKNAGNGGLTYTYNFTTQLSWSNTFFVAGNSKYNPFGTAASNNGVKFERQGTPGLRSVIHYHVMFKKLEIVSEFGLEYQSEFDQLKNYANDGNATLGPAIENSHTRLDQVIAFAQTNIHFITGTILNAGLSFDNNHLKYNNAVEVNGIAEKYTKWYQPAILPSLTWMQHIVYGQHIFASGSAGASAPQLLETVNTDGTLNRRLKNENSWNFEVGLNGLVRKIYFNYKTAFFCQLYRNFILPYNPQSNELVYYQNSGSTRNLGFESSAGFNIPFSGGLGKVFKNLRINGNYSWSGFKFQQFSSSSVNYKGKVVPGVAPQAVNAELNLLSRPGIYFAVNFSFCSATALNNANSTYAPSFYVFDFKVGYYISHGKVAVDIFTGADNAGNTLYYSFLQLNAVGGKYFNPAPGRYVYGGIRFSFKGLSSTHNSTH